MAETFASLLARLHAVRVEFLVAGGVAVSLHGHVRATAALDILVRAEPGNISRLLECLAGWGEGFARELGVGDFLPPAAGSVRIAEDFDLDVFVLLGGRSFDDLRPDAVVRPNPAGGTVAVLSAAALIALKEATGREKDRLDVLALRRLAGASEEAGKIPPPAPPADGPRLADEWRLPPGP